MNYAERNPIIVNTVCSGYEAWEKDIAGIHVRVLQKHDTLQTVLGDLRAFTIFYNSTNLFGVLSI